MKTTPFDSVRRILISIGSSWAVGGGAKWIGINDYSSGVLAGIAAASALLLLWIKDDMMEVK